METTNKIVPMSTAVSDANKGQYPENVLLALSQVYALVQNSIETSTITQAGVGSIMHHAQDDISSLITNLVNGDSSLISAIEAKTKAMGPLGYVILAIVILVLVAAIVGAVVATGGAGAALGAGLAAGIGTAATAVGTAGSVLGGVVGIAKGSMQCETASMQEELAVTNGQITNSTGNQKLWMSDSKHTGATIDNNGQVQSSIESVIYAAIVGEGSAVAAASASIRRSLK